MTVNEAIFSSRAVWGERWFAVSIAAWGQYHLAVAGGSFEFWICDCRLPIGSITKRQSKIGNWQSAIGTPTRYREVVLTSCH